MSDELQELQTNEIKWYVNVPLNELKEIIKDNVNIAAKSFITIGYYLKNIRDRELFKENGYSGILEFAQAEFGISKSWASKWMSINDEFSVDGNSPILLEQYRGFSSGKLSEMLYLTEEQREQITISKTTAEIREIKNPVKEKIDVNAFSSTKTEEGLSSPLGYKKSVYPPDSVITSKGCGNKHSCFSCSRICQIRQEDKYCVDAPLGHPYSCTTMNILDSIENDIGSECMFLNLELAYHRVGDHEPAPCCKECKNKCGYACSKAAHHKQEPEKVKNIIIDDLELSVRTYNCLKHAGIDTVNELCKLTEIEVGGIRSISHRCMDEIKLKLSEIGRGLKLDGQSKIMNDIPEIVNDETEIVNNLPEIMNDVDNQPESNDLVLDCFNHEEGWHKEIISGEPELVETVEADIIQTETEPSPPWKQKQVIKDSIKQEEEMLNQLRETWKTKQPDTLVKHETLLMAYKRFLIELEHPNPEPVKPEQPDLPIFKNNDQRKEWIEAYPTWPLWIDSKETEERYYRYDFENGEAFVIRVGMHHKYLGWDKGGYSKTETEYNHEEYWIVKAGKLFSECEASKSTMVDYLKEIQKK